MLNATLSQYLFEMQNEITLRELGFRKPALGEFLYRGMFHKFIAKVVDYNGPTTYVELFIVMREIDNRPLSDRKGHHYRKFLKACCSQGSVYRAIEKFDEQGAD